MQTTYKPSADDVKRLRETTGGGMIDCRNALVKTEGDMERAKALLQELGQARAEKKAAERSANEGIVGSYIHTGGKVGVLVEINCETDFVARNDKFRDLVRDVAMHIAAMPAEYLDRGAVPAEKIAELRVEFAKSAEGKPPAIAEKIVDGKLNKWFEDHVVLEQSFVKDDSMTVQELVNSVSGVLGEKMTVRRFAKFALGE
jgi:elongation factor Ts